MKKLLLFASLALTTLSGWAQSEETPVFTEDEYQIEVNFSTGSLCRKANGQYTWSDTHGAAFKWSSTKVENAPKVSIAVPNESNNLMYVKSLTGSDHEGFDDASEGNLLSLYAGGVNYKIYADDANWYVSNISFGITSNIEGVSMTVNRTAYPIAASAHNNFEFQYAYGDDVMLTFTQATRAFVAMPDFVITVKRVVADDVLPAVLNKYNFDKYPQLFTAEAAEAANQAIRDKAEELFATDGKTIPQINEELIAEADAQFEKLCAEQISGHYFMFQNRDTQRYMAVVNSGTEEDPQFESRMIDNTEGTDQRAIWLMTWDSANKKFRLHNYESDYDLSNIGGQNQQIPVVEHADLDQQGPGALFSMTPVRIVLGGEELYIVEFRDNADGGYHYIHDGKRLNYPIKWNDADGSPGSGWYASMVNVNPDGDLAGLLAFEGKNVIVYNMTTQKYLSKVGETGLGEIDELRPSAIWTFNGYEVNEGHDQANIELKNALSGKYIKNLTSNLTDTDQSALRVDNVEGELETWYIYSRTGTAEGANKFTITEFTTDNMDQMISELTSKFAYEFGEEPGQYTLGANSDKAEFENIKSSIETIKGEDSFDLKAAQAAYDYEIGDPTIFDLNALEGPALIRISTIVENTATTKAYVLNSNYSTESTSVVTYNSNADAADYENTIFVLHEGKIASYLDGKYLKSDGSQAPFIWNSEDAAENEGNTLVFDGCISKTKGAYSIGYYEEGNKRYYMHCAGYNTVYGSATSDQGYVAQLEAQENWYGYFFNVEYVKTLAVSVEENGLKLWRTPVTINFGDNDNNGAYVVKVTGTKITTTQAEASTNYGAGTIFVLTKDINVNVVNGSALEAPVAGLGHHAVKNHEVTPDMAYLTIHEDQNGDAQTASDLYYEGAEDAPSVRLLVKMYDTNDNVKLDAHTPVIAVEKNEYTELTDGGALTLPLGGSAETTQISEVIVGASAPAAIYDLQGRKLATPAKGINIINGKKHLVK